MRRLAALIALTLGMLLPADAGAGEPYAGKGDGFEISFQVVTKGGEPTRIKDFRFRRVVMTCASGPTTQFKTRSLPPHFGPFRVNDEGRFGRTFTSDNQNFQGETVIRGEFVTKRRVDGTLKIAGDYPADGYADCTSSRLPWTARLS